LAAPAWLDIAPELQKFRLDHKKCERKLKQLMQHKRRDRAPRLEVLDMRYKKPLIWKVSGRPGAGVIGSEEAKLQ